MELIAIHYNWSGTTASEDKFNVVAVIGVTTACKIFRSLTVCGSMLHATFWILAECTWIQLTVVAFTLTAMVCLLWYLRVSMSHLSDGRNLQRRLERRKIRIASIHLRKQLVVAIILCGMSSAHAMEEQVTTQETFLQRMTSMAEAPTRAAVAAEETLVRTTTTGGAGSNDGLQAASGILKAPDTFNGDDVMVFQQWKRQFTSWLCFGDSRYADALDLLEKKDAAPPWASYNADAPTMAQKLYAVLTSYTSGANAPT